jgi:hypothetical protein
LAHFCRYPGAGQLPKLKGELPSLQPPAPVAAFDGGSSTRGRRASQGRRKASAQSRRRPRIRRSRRAMGYCIILPRRSNIALLRRPWHAIFVNSFIYFYSSRKSLSANQFTSGATALLAERSGAARRVAGGRSRVHTAESRLPGRRRAHGQRIHAQRGIRVRSATTWSIQRATRMGSMNGRQPSAWPRPSEPSETAGSFTSPRGELRLLAVRHRRRSA